MADTAKSDTREMQRAHPAAENREKKKKPNFMRPKNKDLKTIPKPTSLSKTEIRITNDPLWKDSFIIDGETGFGIVQAAREFEADAAGYVQLVESEYKAISAVDKYYGKLVPASAHAYYHGILYWYKIALIAQNNGMASQDQHRLVQFVQGHGSAQIASGAGEYLEGLGDYTDLMGVRHKLHAAEPNSQGHFGRVNAQTHSLYETLPAPAVLLQRTVEDMHASQPRVAPRENWMVEDIAPQNQPRDKDQGEDRRERVNRRREAEEGEADRITEGGDEEEDPDDEDDDDQVDDLAYGPTVNLLGWRRPNPFNADQMDVMRNVLDVREPRALLENQSYSVNGGLFELVEHRLRECERYKLSIIPNTTTGSIIQQVIWKPMESVTTRNHQAIESIGVAMSRTTLPLRAAVAAKVMCYRSLRREIEEDDGTIRNSWSCYSLNKYREVPLNWIGNRNVLINRGNDGLINYTPFMTQITPRNGTLVEYLNKFKVY